MNNPAEDEDARPELQRDVQRLLGRCLLRIQQYELLLKAMLAQHELAGTVESLKTQHVERADKLSDKTLGTLVKALFETYIVPPGFERDLLPENKTPVDRVSMAFSFRLEMTLEHRSATKKAVEDLVELRNQLVHHLVERFDLQSEQGCIDAARYLEESYGRIDSHFLELAAWAKAMDETRTSVAEFTKTDAFRDLMFNGLFPDGTFEWPQTGIVRVLREASSALAVDGWARLESARSWIAEKHLDQVPQKYGCRTWPQVLSESRLFELQYREEGGRKVPWFRPRG